jgi:hypothetical protein
MTQLSSEVALISSGRAGHDSTKHGVLIPFIPRLLKQNNEYFAEKKTFL